MKMKFIVGFVIMAFVIHGSFIQAEAKEFDYKSPEFKAVAQQFACTCGCGQDHYECDPNTCNLTVDFKADLVEMMNKGWDKDKIREYYINIYGEEILTSPEKKGFSLTAWVLPFAAIGVSGGALFMIIRKWVKRKGTDEISSEPLSTEDEVEGEILSSIIDEERKKYL